MKTRIILLGLAVTFCSTFWWFYVRAAAPSLSPHIRWHFGGRDFAVIVHVTREGEPVSNYDIGVENLSGGILRAVTDSKGVATVSPNLSYPYSYVAALHLGGRRVALRPVPGGEHFVPSCMPHGITFKVAL